MTASQRRALVRKLIGEGDIATQEELRELLEKRGVVINQATLSRDLAEIGAQRVRRREGGTVYSLSAAVPVPALDLESLVTDIASNGQLVVVHTSPGAASAVALMIDSAKLEDVLGTIAGDDTVFVAPKKQQRANRLAEQLWNAISGSRSAAIARSRVAELASERGEKGGQR